MLIGAPLTIVRAPTAQAQSVSPITVSRETVLPARVLANCYAYVRYTIPNFPPASLVTPNSTPHTGAVAIFDYHGLPHFGIVGELKEDGFMLTDTNYGGPGLRTHFITWDNPYLVGFWAA